MVRFRYPPGGREISPMHVQVAGHFYSLRGRKFKSLRFIPLKIYENAGRQVSQMIEGSEEIGMGEITFSVAQKYAEEEKEKNEKKAQNIEDYISNIKESLSKEGITKDAFSKCDLIIARRPLFALPLGGLVLVILFKRDKSQRLEDFISSKPIAFPYRRFGIPGSIYALTSQMVKSERPFSAIYLVKPAELKAEDEMSLVSASTELGTISEATFVIFSAVKGIQTKLSIMRQQVNLSERKAKIYEEESNALKRRVEGYIKTLSDSVTIDSYEKQELMRPMVGREKPWLYLLLGGIGGAFVSFIGTKLGTAEWNISITETFILNLLIGIGILILGFLIIRRFFLKKKGDVA